MLWWNRID